jgi:hypothetical protein
VADANDRCGLYSIRRGVEEGTSCFKPIIYSGKDPNQLLIDKGSAYLKQIIESQIAI